MFAIGQGKNDLFTSLPALFALNTRYLINTFVEAKLQL